MLEISKTSIVSARSTQTTLTPHQEYLARGSLKDQARKLFLKSFYNDIPDNELTTNWNEDIPIRTRRHIEAHIIVLHLAPDTISHGIPTFNFMFLKKLNALDSLEKVSDIIIQTINRENNQDTESITYVNNLFRTLQFIETLAPSSVMWSKISNTPQILSELVLTDNEKKEIREFKEAWIRSPPTMKASN